MNKLASHMNERDHEDMKWGYESNIKKDLKELKVTTYTNKVQHFSFQWLDHRNSKVKRV